jgi:hypothetical protein
MAFQGFTGIKLAVPKSEEPLPSPIQEVKELAIAGSSIH